MENIYINVNACVQINQQLLTKKEITMKKIIAILLAMVMMFSMVACCNNDADKDPTTPPTASQDGEKDPTTNPDADPSEPDTTEPSVDDRQAMWEQVFSEGSFVMNANSFKMDMGDIMNITLLTDANGKAYMSISGTVEEEGEITVALYAFDEKTAYFYMSGEAEGQAISQWYKCEINNDEDGAVLDDTMDGTADMSEMMAALEAIEKIVYVESIGDIDVLDIYYTPAADEEDDWTTTYDATIKVEFNGIEGEFRYTESTSDDGWGTSSSSYWEKEIEGMDLFDWDFNRETMTLTKDDQTLNCTLVTDHLNVEGEEQKTVMRIEIDSKTKEIKKMSVTEDDATVAVEFITCEDVSAEVELPETVETTMTMEDAAMQFAMTMFAIIMSNAEM
jgi:hypothetical protein